MAITSSAKKAHRQSLKKKVFNDRRKVTLKKTLKSFEEGKTAEGLSKAYKALDKATKTGVIKKGTADRKKSRLAKSLAKKA
jgi:small subunit ribosomal protein S20